MHVAGRTRETKTIIQAPYSAAGQLEAISPDVDIAREVLPRDANLIVAAPELLEALKAVLADVHSIDNDSCLTLPVGKQLKAAIAKAEGASHE